VKILLAKVTRSRKGHPIRAEGTVDADSPVLGRGADCAIHLPDPRVALAHATISGAAGARRVSAIGTAALNVDGRRVGDLALAPGTQFEVGPYLLTVEEPPAGADLALSYELVRPLPEGITEIAAKSRLSLDASGVSKRSLAWLAFVLIAGLFLVLPVFNATTPVMRALTADLKVSPDIAWNPGPLSSAHQWLTYDCGACHKLPFQRVRDAECLKCHENMPGHVHDQALQTALFGATRCAECHLDHLGAKAPVRADALLCQTCHQDIKSALSKMKGALAETTLPNVGDFDAADAASRHPEFRLTLWRGPKPEDVVRVKQSDKAALVETSGLKFPHDVHLKPGLKGPDGRETLKCATCHAPDAGEHGFVPVSMERHCLRCHELRFEPAVTSRQVPHGSVEDAWLLIQEFYANVSLANVAVDTVDTGAVERRVPNASEAIVTEEQRRRALAFAQHKAQQVGADLFEKRVCVTCHDVRRSDAAAREDRNAAPWTVAPVHVNRSWLPHGRFDHAKHKTAQSECKDCHHAERSHKSSDVLIPDIASCRTCHTGTTPVAGKVVSTCISCHGYHLDASGARIRPNPAAFGVIKQ
jgi:hypothetical protein